MAELVDARDSKSRDGNIMRVRFSLPALLRSSNRGATKCTAPGVRRAWLVYPHRREVALRSLGEVGHALGMHYVYILQDERAKLYVGYSSDLKKRLKDHQYKEVSTTKIYKEPQLVWYCAFRGKKTALDFEKYLKAGSGHAFARKHLV